MGGFTSQHQAELALRHDAVLPFALTLSPHTGPRRHGTPQHVDVAGAAGAAGGAVAVGGQRPAHSSGPHAQPRAPAEVSSGWLPTQAQRGPHRGLLQ